jgi:PAS domain S-box-containing protein
MPSTPANVLVWDENGTVSALLKQIEEDSPELAHYVVVGTSAELENALTGETGTYAAIISPRKMPNGTGLDTAGDVWIRYPNLQILIVQDDEASIDALDWTRQFGASDRAIPLIRPSAITLRHVISALITKARLESHHLEAGNTRLMAAKGGFGEDVEYERSLIRAFMENSPDRLFFKDTESRYVRSSDSLARQFGLDKPAEAVGKSDFDFFSEEYALATFADDQQVIRTGEPILGKKERETTPDGKSSWVLTSRIPWRNPDGRVIGTFGIAKDITELVEAELEMEQYRELLQALLDHMPDRIYFKNTQSRFVKVSKALASRLGVEDPMQVVGKTDFDFHPPDLARQFMQDEELIMATGNPLVNKIEKQSNPSGDTIWASVTKVPIYDSMQEISGLIGISRDITALKRTERELQEKNEDLVETSRLAGMAEVATGVLHNVGNVLNSVNVSANVISETIGRSKTGNLDRVCQLLAKHQDNLSLFLTEDEKGRQIPTFLEKLAAVLRGEQETLQTELTEMRKNVDHIGEIIATQQGYAKVGGTIEQISPEELIDQALHMEGSSLSRHDVDVVKQIQETPQIFVVKNKLLQVLVNLIRNSKQAMLEASPKELYISARNLDENDVEISVRDTGKGISKENLETLFVHGFTTKKDGHGFGLHSSALAIKEMGGSISAESEGLGKGAKFIVRLPTKLFEKETT